MSSRTIRHQAGRVYRETDSARRDRETTLHDLSTGQYNDPIRVIAFNMSEGWSRDVSHEFAEGLQRRADLDRVDLTGTLKEFAAAGATAFDTARLISDPERR